MKKILILFAKDWDQIAIQAKQDSKQYQFYFEGFDLVRFPENINLLFLTTQHHRENVGKHELSVVLQFYNPLFFIDLKFFY